MKHIYSLIFAIFIAITVLGACKDNTSRYAGQETLDKDASYAFGMSVGTELESMFASQIIPHVDEFIKGISDIMHGRETRFNIFEAMDILDKAFVVLMEDLSEEARREEDTFMAENARRPGVIVTSSGLQYEVITEGSGPRPTAANAVRAHYEGRLIDGQIFDSSYYRGEPWIFALDEVIPGWTEGIQLMTVGSQYIFYIPSELGYGASGVGPIPPFATLIFTVDLLEILN